MTYFLVVLFKCGYIGSFVLNNFLFFDRIILLFDLYT